MFVQMSVRLSVFLSVRQQFGIHCIIDLYLVSDSTKQDFFLLNVYILLCLLIEDM